MPALLALSGLIDRINIWIGKLAMWLILATTLISAGNAIVRKVFDTSSNAFLEVQWYLFAAVFMLGSGYALLKNAHVRIDFVASHLSPRTRNWIDVIGILAVLTPFCIVCITLSWPLFVNAWETGEMSNNAGGLIRWPVYLLVPAGFSVLLLQGFSELVKRIAFLRGMGPDTLAAGEPEEDQVAHELAGEHETRRAAGE